MDDPLNLSRTFKFPIDNGAHDQEPILLETPSIIKGEGTRVLVSTDRPTYKQVELLLVHLVSSRLTCDLGQSLLGCLATPRETQLYHKRIIIHIILINKAAKLKQHRSRTGLGG